MLIVALQDDVDNLYAIWNTVSDRFWELILENMKLLALLWTTKKNALLKML